MTEIPRPARATTATPTTANPVVPPTLNDDDPCDDIRCENGTCEINEEEAPECVCDAGWEGAGCNMLIPPPQTGLQLWLDADDIEGDGSIVTGSVSQWVDKSGAGNDFTSPGADVRPDAVEVDSGRTVLRFDGIDDFLELEGFEGLYGEFNLELPLSYTVAMVVRADTSGDGAHAFVSGSGIDSGGRGLLIETEPGNNVRFLHRMPFGNSGGDNLVTTGGGMSTTRLNLVRLERETEQLIAPTCLPRSTTRPSSSWTGPARTSMSQWTCSSESSKPTSPRGSSVATLLRSLSISPV